MKFRKELLGALVAFAAAALLALGMRLTVHPCAFIERSDVLEWSRYDCGARRE